MGFGGIDYSVRKFRDEVKKANWVTLSLAIARYYYCHYRLSENFLKELNMNR
ncbi:unnamed protein product, partial [marine sediment metagenome]